MRDKFSFMLLVLLVIIGVFAYDRYLIEKGDPSPIAELIEFTGLSADVDWYRLRHESVKRARRTQVESDLVLLERNYQQVKELRRTVGNEQQAILGEIIERGQLISQEAKRYAKMLQKKRNDVVGRFSEMEKLGQDLTKDFEQLSDKEQVQRFQKYEATLIDAFQQIIKESDANMVDVMDSAADLERIVKKKEIQDGCRRVDFCLQTKVREINGIAWEILKSNFRRYLMVINELHEHADSIEKEYRILQDTYALTFEQIEEADKQIVHQFRMLVQDYAQVTEENFNDLYDHYAGLNDKRELFLSTVDLNQQRVEMAAQRYIKKMGEAVQIIEQYPRPGLSEFVADLNVLVEEEKRRLQQLKDNYLYLKQLSQGVGEENINFLENLSQTINEEEEKESSLLQRIFSVNKKENKKSENKR